MFNAAFQLSGVNLGLAVGVIIASYLIGNISPAILIGRLRGIDIRKEGSGNAGTTNVLRVMGKKAAAATLLIDALKGCLAVWFGCFFMWYIGTGGLYAEPLFGRVIVMYLGGEGVYMPLLCGIAVIFGHIWPVAFGFRGGKGVATALGVIAATAPFLALIEAFIVLSVVALSRRMSAGSLTGAALFPLVTYWLISSPHYMYYVQWAAILAVIIIFKHRANLVRLLKGQEPKLSFKK